MKVEKIFVIFLVFGLSLILVANVEAEWKFWNKDKGKKEITMATIFVPSILKETDPTVITGINLTMINNIHSNKSNTGAEISFDISKLEKISDNTPEGCKTWFATLGISAEEFLEYIKSLKFSVQKSLTNRDSKSKSMLAKTPGTKEVSTLRNIFSQQQPQAQLPKPQKPELYFQFPSQSHYQSHPQSYPQSHPHPHPRPHSRPHPHPHPHPHSHLQNPESHSQLQSEFHSHFHKHEISKPVQTPSTTSALVKKDNIPHVDISDSSLLKLDKIKSDHPQSKSGPEENKNIYSSNPTYSKGRTITKEDLEKLSEALYIKDTNNVNRYIKLNLQRKTNSNDTTDDASQPLFTVNPKAYKKPTIQKVISMYDKYNARVNVHNVSSHHRHKENALINTFLNTNVMSAAMRFLAKKDHICNDYYEYKDVLRKLWFTLYSQEGGRISSAFKHVFMSELKKLKTGTNMFGLHNWIFYSKEESKGNINYNGYIKKIDIGDKASIIKVRSQYNGYIKPVTTLFVGTSPELEMALYTVCFYARPNGSCPVSLGGIKFDIFTSKFKYKEKDFIETAYPKI